MLGRSSQRCIVWALCLAFGAVALFAVLRWDRLRLGWYEWRLRSSDPGARTAAAAALLSMKTEAARKILRDIAGEWVEASVRAVDAEEEILVLSAGRDHKVREGDQGLVLKPSGGLQGKFTVIKLYPELSGARIEPGGSPIQPGDLAFVVASPQSWGLPAREALHAQYCLGEQYHGGPNPSLIPREMEGIESFRRRSGVLGAAADSAGNSREIRTTIKAVDSSEGLVVLVAGRDDGLELGRELTVTRGDSFVGKIQVIKVYPNLSAARIVSGRDGLAIQPGDTADTRPR
jgi:hypothetical protein